MPFSLLLAFVLSLAVVVSASGSVGRLPASTELAVTNSASDVPGVLIAFFVRGGGRRYLTLTTVPSGRTRLVRLPRPAAKGKASSLEFSADGKTVSGLAGGVFFVARTADARLIRTVGPPQLGRGVLGARLAPDGRQVAVIHKVYRRNSSCLGDAWISVLNASGKGRRLTALPPLVRPTGERSVFIDEVSWSPDSRWLTYTVSRFDASGDCRGNEYESGLLFRTAAAGSAVVQLRRTSDGIGSPIWSPDGGFLSYSEGSIDHGSLFVVRPNGSGRRRLASFGVMDGVTWVSEAWSSARSIVFAGNRLQSSASNVADLYVADVRRAGLHHVAKFDFTTTVHDVSADRRFVALESGDQEIAILTLADGVIAERAQYRSPRSDLRFEEEPVAVWLRS